MTSTPSQEAVAVLFWSHVQKQANGCWAWTAYRNPKGYGMTSAGLASRLAHRAAWALAGRALVKGLTLDHLCRNRACVNPDHLEQISNRENVLRGDTLPAANLRKTHCTAGHALSGSNLVTRQNGERRCRTCRRAHQERYSRAHPGKSHKKAGVAA